jgi:hypothetical protein
VNGSDNLLGRISHRSIDLLLSHCC